MIFEYIKNCKICELEFCFKSKKKSKPVPDTCSKECSYKLRILTRQTLHEPIEKICSICNIVFSDTSKKKKVKKCLKCIGAGMSETRRNNGSYVRTKEQNKQLSDTFVQKYLNGWNFSNPERRKKLSDNLKKRWADGSMKDQTVSACRKKYGSDHWTQSDEGRLVLSKQAKGRKFSDKAMQNFKKGAEKRVKNNTKLFTRGKGGYRCDIGHYVRSSWEANFARIMIYENKAYEYEPEVFKFKNGNNYTPDFKIEGVFYELKGYLSALSKLKIDLFKEEFSHLSLVVIDHIEYDKLRQKYKDIISWEGK